MSSITPLSEDTLREIFQYCTIECQFALLHTCQGFKELLQSIWQRNWKVLELDLPYSYNRINLPDGTTYKISNEDLKLFLESIHMSLQVIKLGATTPERFDIIQKYCFSKTHELHLCVNQLDATLDGSLFSFPNVRFLKITGYDSIQLGQQWNSVEELDLTNSLTSPDNLWETISQMQLKTLTLNTIYGSYPPQIRDYAFLNKLQELSINVDEITLVQNAVGSMESLKKLTLFRSNFTTYNISHLQMILPSFSRQRVVELIACKLYNKNANFLECVSKHVRELPDLRKLTVVGQSLEDGVKFAKRFPILREFNMFHSNIEHDDLEEFLKIAKQVDLLQFYECHSWPIAIHADEITAYRSTPITVNIFDPGDYSSCDIGLFDARTELINITRKPMKSYHADILYELIFEQF